MTETSKTIIRKKLTGVVVSAAMQKTVVVEVDRLVKAPKYGKYFTRSKRYQAHDEQGAYKVGDKVVIAEGRPRSRHKRFEVMAKV